MAVESTPFSFGFQLPPQPGSGSYAFASNVQFHPHDYHGHTHKRRKVDTSPPMPPSDVSSRERLTEVKPACGRDHGHPRSMPTWSASVVTHPVEASSSLPLAKRMANLSSLLCPCCGFGWGQPDGTRRMSLFCLLSTCPLLISV